MIEFLQDNSVWIAMMGTPALTLVILAIVSRARDLTWVKIEPKIRDLTPDQYEDAVLRYLKAVQQAFIKAGKDINDPAVQKEAALIVDALIQVVLFGRPVTVYLDQIFKAIGLGLPLETSSNVTRVAFKQDDV